MGGRFILEKGLTKAYFAKPWATWRRQCVKDNKLQMVFVTLEHFFEHSRSLAGKIRDKNRCVLARFEQSI